MEGKPKVGDRVYFGRPNGEQTLGRVIKVNRTRAKIEQLEARGTQRVRATGTWNVPFSLLRLANGVVTVGLSESTKAKVAKVAPREVSEILRDLRNIEGALSPENLHYDGEISVSAAPRKSAALRRRRRALEKELGRKPTTSELYGRSY